MVEIVVTPQAPDTKPVALRTDHDLHSALDELERLWGAEPYSRDWHQANMLAEAIEGYEVATSPVWVPKMEERHADSGK